MSESKDPIQAVGKIVILKEMERQTKSEGGIIIEGMVNRDPFAIGTVVSVGEGVPLSTGIVSAPPVKKGDVIFYDKNKVLVMNDLVYINSDFIVAIVNDKSQLPTGYYEIK